MSAGAITQANPARLGTVRRLYVYLVTLISFGVALTSFDVLVEHLVNAWMPGPALHVVSGSFFVRNTIAQSSAILVVSVLLFLLHWGWVQGRLDEEGEREAAMRSFFLYAASAFALGYLLFEANNLLAGVGRLALGEPPRASDLLPSAWLAMTITALAAAALLYYWQRVARSDGFYGVEVGLAGTWRRIFQGAVTLTGLAMVVFGSAMVVSALLRQLLDRMQTAVVGNVFPAAMGDGLALLLLGALTARTAWQAWQAVVERSPDEARTVVRLLFLYLAVVGGAVATLVPAALIVRRLLLWVFAGFDDTALDLVDDLAVSVGYLPAGLWIWVRHSRILHALEREPEAASAGEGAATVRRIYYYAVSATGLVLTWLGLIFVVQVVLDLLLTADQLKAQFVWQQPLATGLALLAVGAPVWALHWRAVQRVALQPTPAGAAERSSLPRRIYLFGVAFVGAVLILFFLAQVIYRIFLWALGDRTGVFFSAELAEDLARSAIAAVLWVLHVMALRTDGRLGGVEPAPVDQQRRALEQRIERLEQELTGLRAELATLDSDAGN